jgi:hypothetical protein
MASDGSDAATTIGVGAALGGAVVGAGLGVATGAIVAGTGVATAVASVVGRGVADGSDVGRGVADGGGVGVGVESGLGVAFATANPPGVPATMLGRAVAAESRALKSISAMMTRAATMTAVHRAMTPCRIVRSPGWVPSVRALGGLGMVGVKARCVPVRLDSAIASGYVRRPSRRSLVAERQQGTDHRAALQTD